MSDCSTAAMLPKEPPKRRIGYVLRWEIDDPNENMSQVTEVEVNGHKFVREQRHQQLEQLAREMYDWADGVVNRCYTVVPERVDGFREQLEALGVSLDD